MERIGNPLKTYLHPPLASTKQFGTRRADRPRNKQQTITPSCHVH